MRLHKIWFFLVISLISILVLTACGSNTTTPAGSNPVNSSPAPTPTASTIGTFTDDLGRTVEIKHYPQRIISLAPSNTEIAFALGLGDRIVGVTTYCNYPEEAKTKEKVGGFSDVDMEKIAALQPDLVLASDIHKKEVVPALEKLGISVLIIRPGSIEQIFKDIQMVGQVTGQTSQATSLVTSLQKRVEAVTAKTAGLSADQKPRVFYVTWHDPIYTAGGDTIISDLIKRAGGVNLADDLSGYATMTLETVIDRNPQVIIVMSSMGDQNTSFNYIKTEPRLQATEALKNDRVYIIDSDIFGRTTPRIVDGLEQLLGMVHPELK